MLACRYPDAVLEIELMHYGEVDLEPEYQRDVVWTEARQEALIDSLFHNYYIPPVLFALRVEDDGTEKRTCNHNQLTGESSVASCLGKPKTGPGRGKKYWYRVNEDQKKNLPLPNKEKRIFETKTLVCAEFESLPDIAERDIFQRVQMGMALTPAEKLQALSTPWAKFTTSLLQRYIYPQEDGLWKYLQDWDRSRGRDFQNLATIVYMIEVFPERRANIGAAKLHSWLLRVDPVEDHLKKKVYAVMAGMLEVAREHQESAFQSVKNRISPLEFCFLGVTIYALRDHYPISKIADLFGAYRLQIRSSSDATLRTNASTIANSYKWLERVPKKKRITASADGEVDRNSPQKSKRSKKDADGDFVGAPVVRSQAASSASTRGTR
ncbi:hypothetical protein QFC24_002367 [Naganishia onofrii]|uniref:Uncharacterized protein n=1 Tax=Naganishia onofrii TaxID=1851511 RepID=A0ACC2XR28_9TREE|nr:hypothetical protein QFC24_002367 [Naganishia onofrii]